MEPMNAGASRAKEELKHLKVLRMAVIYMMMCVLNLYEYEKKNLGPLRSIVWTVEVAMINIVAPIYWRFKGVPDDFLGLLSLLSLLTSKRRNTNCMEVRNQKFLGFISFFGMN